MMRRVNVDTVKSRQKELSSRPVYGEHCTLEERKSLQQLLCAKHDAFALTDQELGEVDLIEHKIQMKCELSKLLSAECIEPSSSPMHPD